MGILSWLLRNPSLLVIGLLLISTAGSAALARHEMTKADQLEILLKDAETRLETIVVTQKKLEGISSDYEKNLSLLNHKLSASRLRQSRCIIPTGSITGKPDGATGGNQSMGSVGVPEATMDEFIAEGARYQEQLRALQLAAKEACQGH